MDLAALAERSVRSQCYLLALCVLPALLITLRLLLTLRRLRGTTLLIPFSWALASQLALSSCLIVGLAFPALSRTSDFAAWYFVTACGTVCPFVALVGAKRPQHVAWNFVVASLWCLLALPAVEVVLLQPGQEYEINSFRSWFLVALLAAEAVNFGFTRFGLATGMVVAGKVMLLIPYLPFGRAFALSSWSDLTRGGMGYLLLSLGLLLAYVAASKPTSAANRFDRLWFDFRDSFGLFWALRLMERVNDAANLAGWDFDLGWSGFRTKQDFAPLSELPAEIEQPLQNTLQGLMRRFVSAEWIAERLDLPAEQTGAPLPSEPHHD